MLRNAHCKFMEDSEPTGMGKTLFFQMFMSSLVVTRLLLFITAEVNSYPETEDNPQRVIVISTVGEKSIFHFPADIYLFIFFKSIDFYLTLCFFLSCSCAEYHYLDGYVNRHCFRCVLSTVIFYSIYSLYLQSMSILTFCFALCLFCSPAQGRNIWTSVQYSPTFPFT